MEDLVDAPEQPGLLTPRPSQRAAAESWEQQLLDLRHLFHATLVALLAPVLAGTLFFTKQMLLVRGELTEFRPALHRVAEEYRQKEPKMKEFVAALQAYALTHPDFQPVLQRYQAMLPQYFVTPVSLHSSPIRITPTNAPASPRKQGR